MQPLATLALALLLASTTRAQTMFVESCTLGCSSGSGGVQVACTTTTHPPNSDLRVRFSRPVDGVSLSSSSFRLIDLLTGQTQTGTRFVDPLDDHVVVFQPALSFDGQGVPVFGFAPGATILVMIPGTAQGDAPPFVSSTDAPPLANESRMSCVVQITVTPQTPGSSYCAGTGACPCANPGDGARGCASSMSALGLGLAAQGNASVAQDDVKLYLVGLAPGPAQFFQGTQQENGGAGAPFGDGLLCASGTMVRLRSHAGASSLRIVPSGAQPHISVQGGVAPAGGTRTYQAYYRDATGVCASPSFNWTNAIEIAWQP